MWSISGSDAIVAGDLRERLSTRGVNDPFDRLALIVNCMLDEIEAQVQRLADAGDDIAHDLRTPLTRVCVTLERARQNAANLGDLQAAVDHAINGLDQSLAIIMALLRITAIEHSHRLARFGRVALAGPRARGRRPLRTHCRKQTASLWRRGKRECRRSWQS
ncbi:MAG TPA: hypothetical protein VHU22_01060 [Xanthobacteraceae bacterium]|nr:hypothetical protein [Xanthobacteraceae bacterium]